MATLSFIDKQTLENVLEMGSGYVLDFTNRSFQEIVIDSTGLDIYSEKYQDHGTSKANLLRSFWTKESNQTVSKLLFAFSYYWRNIMVVPMRGHVNPESKFYKGLLIIAERLRDEISEHADAIDTNFGGENFDKLRKIIRELIESNKPDEAIDRLHTYMIMFLRKLLDKHKVQVNKNTPLHSLFGSYKNKLMQAKIIEAGMTEEILKSSIKLLEKYSHVRNNHSLAHANEILNYNESLLIFKVVASTIEFVESIER
ncbi:MAG: abortive infection family protein [Ginsengibacter sp.]